MRKRSRLPLPYWTAMPLVSSVALLLAGCSSEPSPGSSATNKPPSPQYAGSASCEACHREAYAEWKGSHHAKAQRGLWPPLDDQAFNPPRTIKHGSQTASAGTQDGKYVLTTVGNDGQQRGFVPVGVIGVDPLWQYLMPAPGGRLQVTELAFDPAKKEWFDVYGDEDRKYHEWGHWSQRGMNWNSMCSMCHTTDLKKSYDPATDGYRTTYHELGVGCEQCHGPMKSHVDWQEKNKGSSPDPMIKKLDWAQYFSSCASCHSRRADLTGTFRPGDRYYDHYELVLPDLSDTFYPDGQNRDEDFEISAFTLSYMHEQGIRCMDCHSPHASKIKADHNELCMRCHAQAVTTKIAINPAEHGHHALDKAGSRCVDCHMPQTAYMARHLRRDHGMTIPDPLLTKEHGIPNACNRCHADKTVDWSIEYVDKWYGKRMDRPTRRRAQVLASLKKGDRTVTGEAITLLSEQKNPAWRAVFIKFLAPITDELPGDGKPTPVQAAIVRMLDDSSPPVQAAAIDALEPLMATPAETLFAPPLGTKLSALLKNPSRLVRVKAAWALRQQLPADVPARRELIAFLDYGQDQPLGAFQWARFHVDSGNPKEALPWFEKAIAWDPSAATFHHAYAMALDAVGRPEDAIMQAARAATLEPAQGMHAYALGLLYAEIGKMNEAREALRAAIARDPAQGRYWYNLGLAESQLGDVDAAIQAMGKAEQLEPSIAAYPWARATISYDRGRMDEARQALQRVLQIDPSHQQARDLLGRM